MPGAREERKPLMRRFLSRIPLRTKLVLAGALIGVLIAVPMILSMSKGGDGKSSEQKTPVAEETTKPTSNETAAEMIESTTEPTVEPTPTPEAAPTASIPIKREVGGIISEDTTWTKGDEPYKLTQQVIVPKGVTLTIEPGTTIVAENEGDMFLLDDGKIVARGTPENPIVFDGKGKSNFFTCKQTRNGVSVLDLDFATIQNGMSFWNSLPSGRFESLSLTNTTLMNIAEVSNIFYPRSDVYIECNTFINIAGFSIAQESKSKVYIQHNTFEDNTFKKEKGDYWIRNEQCLSDSQTIVSNNSFRPQDGIALSLGGKDAAMVARDNYWGTQDTNVIDSMIHDKADDSALGVIGYEPVLSSPAECP